MNVFIRSYRDPRKKGKRPPVMGSRPQIENHCSADIQTLCWLPSENVACFATVHG